MTFTRLAYAASLLAAALICMPAMAAPTAKPAPAKPAPAAATSTVKPTAAKPATAAAAAGLFRPGATTALDGDRRALVNRLSTYLSSVKTMEGDFVQIGPDGSRSTGKFYIEKPGRVRFQYDPPSPILIIADGQSVAVRDRRLDTQDIYPLSQTPLRFLLAQKINLLKDTNVVGVYGDENYATVVIEEDQPLVGTSRLMLMFDAKDMQLKQWTVTDPQGYDTTVAISNINTTKVPDPSLFRINYQPIPGSADQ